MRAAGPAMRFGCVPGVPGPISRVVLGTSGMREYETAAPLLDAFVAAGGTALDTAAVYGGEGRCERTIGRWIARRGGTKGLILLVKGAHPPHCSPAAVGHELEASLDRLGTPCASLYMLHRDDPAVPVDEWVDALEEQRMCGRLHAWGMSNWTPDRVRAANLYAQVRGVPAAVALSNHLSLAEAAEPLYPGCEVIDDAAGAWLETTGLALFPWSSQARGFFSDADPARLDPNMRRCWDTSSNRRRRDRARLLAERLNVSTINVALAFVLGQPYLTFPIIGPRGVEELDVALGGLRVDLDRATVKWLRDGGPSRLAWTIPDDSSVRPVEGSGP